jgi:tubulin alpha
MLEHDILPLSLTLTSYTIGVDKATFNSFISETGPGPDIPLCVFLNLNSTIIDEVRTGSCKEEDALITDNH